MGRPRVHPNGTDTVSARLPVERIGLIELDAVRNNNGSVSAWLADAADRKLRALGLVGAGDGDG